MVSERMAAAINEQINAEFYSGYLYLSMAAQCEELGYPGFANWFYVQALEEQSHGMRLYRYMTERGARVTLAAIEAPPTRWPDPGAMFRDTLAHERKVTGLINGLVDIATGERDHATVQMLQWFVAEQVEEEATAREMLDKLTMIERGGNLYMLDRELASRTLKVPPGFLGGGQPPGA